MKQRLAVLTFFLFVPAGYAQDPSDVEQRLRADLKFLTSDECEGRGVGTKGLELAAEYIERQFINAGLKPGGVNRSYYQPFQLIKDVKHGPGNRLTLKGPLGQSIALKAGEHFTSFALGGNGNVEGPVVFAGYGITSTNPKYDDYAGIDVTGKIVLVLAGTPRLGADYADVFAQGGVGGDMEEKLENAIRHKAAGLIFVQRSIGKPDFLSRFGPREGDSRSLPAAQIERGPAEAMFSQTGGVTLTDLERRIDADLKPRSMPLSGWTCRLETDVKLTRVAVKNIVGVLEGKGPHANETVVIGAHYDHVGYFGTVSNALKPTSFSAPGGIGGAGFPLAQLWVSGIHHGADDNGSGTVTVMELARRFGAEKNRQGRRLVFIAFSAEESGLVGSFYYCRKPLFPLQDTTTMVNMDMVGRMQDDKLLVGGLGTSKSFLGMIDRLNQKTHLNIWKEPSGTAPTDNTGFYRKSIPVLFFFTGFHEQYHRPTDRFETINFQGMSKITDLIAGVVQEVSSSARPQFARADASMDRTKTLWAKAPATGLVIRFAGSGNGVLLENVIPDTPAARSGLQKGDRVLMLAGKTVNEPLKLLALTRTLNAGQTVDAVFERDGMRHTVKLVLNNTPGKYTDPYFGFVADIGKLKDGVVVTDVPANSLGAAVGLRKGDRVVAVAGRSISNLNSYADAVRSLKSGQSVALSVIRDGKQQELAANQAAASAPVQPPPQAPAARPQDSGPAVTPSESSPPGSPRRRFLRRRVPFCP